MSSAGSKDQSINHIKEYYGKVLGGSHDLQTNACCTTETLAPHVAAAIENVHQEVKSKFYGCGSPIPLALEGCSVLDLGCGTGRDTYVASQLVGAKGHVIGVDMTSEQLAVAREHLAWHTERFDYPVSNVDFRQGFIEDLASIGIPDASIDVVLSNCVINLSPDKPRVFSEIFRVLKPGGELIFSDVFASRRLAPEIATDPILTAECLGGALYTEDFRRMLLRLGVPDYRVVSSRELAVHSSKLAQKLGCAKFYSNTIRCFKIDSLEDRCEDFGQACRYKGTIPNAPHAFTLDDHHTFENGAIIQVCGNTAAMLSETRLAEHFEHFGDTSVHLGLFECGSSAPSDVKNAALQCC